MKKILFLSLFVLCALFISGCHQTYLNKGSFGSFKRSLNTKSYGYKIIEDPTGSAPTPLVERFEVRHGDCGWSGGWSDCSNDRERSELSGTKDNYSGSEYWYGWHIYIPPDWNNIYPTKTALGQFHQSGGSRPAFMFQNRDGGYWVDRNFGNSYGDEKIIKKEDFIGKWNKIEIHAKWNKKDGFFIVYVNGEKKYDFKGTTKDEQAVYFKYGIYRSFMTRYLKGRYEVVFGDAPKIVPTQIALYSNVKRSKAREGLLP